MIRLIRFSAVYSDCGFLMFKTAEEQHWQLLGVISIRLHLHIYKW